jgi:tetratricopeptide (TPR) repeat protein
VRQKIAIKLGTVYSRWLPVASLLEITQTAAGDTKMAVAGWEWHAKARGYLDAGNVEAAEDLYVEVGEQPTYGAMAASAINSLAFNLLIPQQRFEEARLWLQDAINLEAGYESWNARSNLGLCEFFAGNIDSSKRYFQQVVDADEGPVSEAKEYLARIKVKDIPKAPKSLNLEYTDEWEGVDVSGPVNPDSTQREFYLRFVKYLVETDLDVDLDMFNQAPAACATGFANGVLQGKSGEIGISRDAVSKAYFDYVRTQFLFIDEDYDPLSYGEDQINEEDDPEEGLKHLRVAAGEGNAEAMLRVGEVLADIGMEDEALPWLRLASANGKKKAKELLESLEEDRWLDDEVDDD